MIKVIQGRCIPDDVHGLIAHVSGWEPYNLHDLRRGSRVGSVLVQTLHNNIITAGLDADDLDDDGQILHNNITTAG